MAFVPKLINKRIQRFFNYKLSVYNNLSPVRCQIPGFSYADLDRTGQVNLCALNRLLETVRLFAHGVKNLQLLSHPTERTVLVMLGQRFSVHPHLFKNFALDFPMELEVNPVAISKSSLVKRVSLSEIKTGMVVVSALQKLVHIDTATKKSCELPQEVVDMWSGIRRNDVQDVFEPIIPQKPAETAFVCSQVIKHSDMDYFMHTNQGSYLRFVYDCAAEAASQNVFHSIKQDICRYHALQASTLHMSETFAGDVLCVKVWEDNTNPYRLHSAIFKNNVNVFYSDITLTENI